MLQLGNIPLGVSQSSCRVALPPHCRQRFALVKGVRRVGPQRGGGGRGSLCKVAQWTLIIGTLRINAENKEIAGDSTLFPLRGPSIFEGCITRSPTASWVISKINVITKIAIYRTDLIFCNQHGFPCFRIHKTQRFFLRGGTFNKQAQNTQDITITPDSITLTKQVYG